MNYRTLRAIAAYVISAGILSLVAYSAWFATMWGLNPLALLPLHIIGLLLCGIAIAVARMLGNSN